MRFLLIAFCLLATTALACGGRNPTGAIGSAGAPAAGTGGASVIGGNGGGASVGAGGGTNVGGSGGPSGNWACTVCRLGTSRRVVGTIYDGDNRTVTAAVSAAVTVSSIGVVSVFDGVETQIVLASTTSSDRWTWNLRIPNLPGDLIRAGESFDLDVSTSQATLTPQTIVLSRGGSLVAFTAQTPLTPPALDAWGISVADAGVLCEDDNTFPCVQRAHLALITVEGESATVAPDQTVTVRDLSLSMNLFEEGCRGAFTVMGGFRPFSSGGIGGSTGAAGTGGAGGGAGGAGGRTASPYPACTGSWGPCDVAYGTIQDGNDQVVVTQVTAAVTVSEIDREPAGNNNRVHITLADTASAQRWTWTPAIPNLPATRINVGERFDLTVDAYLCGYIGASPCQTVVLARAGSLIAFSVDLLGAAGVAALPTLKQWGIGLDDVGVFCESGGGAGGACGSRSHSTRVSVGTESVIVEPYHTVMIHGLSFSVGQFQHTTGSGTCLDVSPRTTMAGFRLP